MLALLPPMVSAMGAAAVLASAMFPLPERLPKLKALPATAKSKVMPPVVRVLFCSAFWLARSSVPALTVVAPV